LGSREAEAKLASLARSITSGNFCDLRKKPKGICILAWWKKLGGRETI